MAMQGIDCASYQAGIDPSVVPCDFVIVKSTQGTTYVNPDFQRLAEATLAAGKALGIYHYASGGNATDEANHMLDVAGGYIGRAIFCLDWEGIQNSAFGSGRDSAWIDEFCSVIENRVGSECLVYLSKSVMGCASGHKLWVAQYANMNRTGYQDNPWNEGAYDCAIRQYTSMGRLDGWGGDLDLNKAYMSREEWDAWAASAQPTGWIKQDGRWWYRHADGSYTKSGWEKIDGKWYLFDADGWMLTGWQKVGGKWYYLTDSGAMATGWVNDGGKWYYMDPDTGAMHAADVESIGGKWYAFGADGEMQYGVGSDASGALKV
nr:MAG TPA: LysA like endolysin [Caudoviricetes sp.]